MIGSTIRLHLHRAGFSDIRRLNWRQCGMTINDESSTGRIAGTSRLLSASVTDRFRGPACARGDKWQSELVNERQWLAKEQMREDYAICQSLTWDARIKVGTARPTFLPARRLGARGLGGLGLSSSRIRIVAAIGGRFPCYSGDLKPGNCGDLIRIFLSRPCCDAAAGPADSCLSAGAG